MRNFTQSEPVNVKSAIAKATAAPDPVTDQEPDQEPDQSDDKPRKRRNYSDEEARLLKTKGKTSGRKDMKMDRINLAFTPENYEYIYIMGRVSGEGMTTFVNKVLERHRLEHADLYDKAIAFRDALDQYNF